MEGSGDEKDGFFRVLGGRMGLWKYKDNNISCVRLKKMQKKGEESSRSGFCWLKISYLILIYLLIT